jgi:hypothetical protein
MVGLIAQGRLPFLLVGKAVASGGAWWVCCCRLLNPLQLDEDLRSWLIEVNTNPYLGVQNSWHGGCRVARPRFCLSLFL